MTRFMFLHSPVFPKLSEFPFYSKTTITANDEIAAVVSFCARFPDIVAEHIIESPPRAFDYFPEYGGCSE